MVGRFFSRVFGGGQVWDLGDVTPPWGDRPSLYEHVRAHVVPGEDGLTEGGDALPDDDAATRASDLRFAPGALDGTFGHHGAGKDDDTAADHTFAALTDALAEASDDNLSDLYQALIDSSALEILDTVLQRLADEPSADAARAHELALWLVARAADREAVKFGVALLGVTMGFDDLELLLTIGRHEEFTLYAVVAVANTVEEPDRSLWQLARSVNGWGRIQTVERLLGTNDPDIHAWMVRAGYKNTVMWEYLAYGCATTGRLHEALAPGEIDAPLFEGAGDLLATLVMGDGGPAESIDDYEHAGDAVVAYLRHAGAMATSLGHFVNIGTLHGFLLTPDGWHERYGARGWTETIREEASELAKVVVLEPRWRDLAETQLDALDPVAFSAATAAARLLDIDTWDHYFARLKRGESNWYFVMQTDDVERIGEVIDLAESTLPLDDIASGPAEESGMGEQWQAHGALDFLLQDLGRFPGLGWKLIRAGLQSPVIRNRWMAIQALASWQRDDWPDETDGLLAAAVATEPDAEVKEALSAVRNQGT